MTRFAYMTSEQLAQHPIPHKRTELVRGRLVIREPSTLRHGDVTARTVTAISNYLEENPIGRAYTADPGFTLERNPDTVRAPDVAYISQDRIPTAEVPGFDELAPDLAVEVRSPGDRTRALQRKVRQWLDAGTRLVWLIDPAKGTAHVFRRDGTDSALARDDALDGEDVLPGFRVALRRLLPE